MPPDLKWKIVPSDLEILRRLAHRQAEISEAPDNIERRRLWLLHNSLRGQRPMLLAETGGVLNEFLAGVEFECQEEWARGLERELRLRILQYERVGDDAVVEPYVNVGWRVDVSDYGLEIKHTRGDSDGAMGSYVWEAPIKNLRTDLDKMHPRTYRVDRQATLDCRAHLEDVLEGILKVRIRCGGFWWSMGMTWVAIQHIGLENLMLFMYDDPEGLHRLMAFLRDDHLAFAQWSQREGLLTPNNENDYIGSGGHGYCDELPLKDCPPAGPARLKDLWVLSESQETVGVGPEFFGEFVFPYQLPIIEKFGLCYYGCCEPLHSRWEILKRIPNLRTLSISPWCDEQKMAAALGRRYVYARKPNPAQISTPRWDEDAIRADIRRTLTVAKGCEIEFAMKDVHTLANQPHRLGRWVRIARDVIDEFYD
jgi:hypothetical protein